MMTFLLYHPVTVPFDWGQLLALILMMLALRILTHGLRGHSFAFSRARADGIKVDVFGAGYVVLVGVILFLLAAAFFLLL